MKEIKTNNKAMQENKKNKKSIARVVARVVDASTPTIQEITNEQIINEFMSRVLVNETSDLYKEVAPIVATLVQQYDIAEKAKLLSLLSSFQFALTDGGVRGYVVTKPSELVKLENKQQILIVRCCNKADVKLIAINIVAILKKYATKGQLKDLVRSKGKEGLSWVDSIKKTIEELTIANGIKFKKNNKKKVASKAKTFSATESTESESESVNTEKNESSIIYTLNDFNIDESTYCQLLLSLKEKTFELNENETLKAITLK